MEVQLFEILMDRQVLSMSVAIIALLYGVGKIPIPGSTLERNRLWRRVLPVLPLALGVAGAIATSAASDDADPSVAHSVMLGLWAGFVAAHGRKIVKRLIVDKIASPKAQAGGQDEGEI